MSKALQADGFCVVTCRVIHGRIMPGYTDTMDPMRLQPVSMITAHQGADACVCELTDPLDLSQPTVVHHLTVLKHAGFSPEASAAARPITRSSPNSLDAAAATLMTA